MARKALGPEGSFVPRPRTPFRAALERSLPLTSRSASTFRTDPTDPLSLSHSSGARFGVGMGLHGGYLLGIPGAFQPCPVEQRLESSSSSVPFLQTQRPGLSAPLAGSMSDGWALGSWGLRLPFPLQVEPGEDSPARGSSRRLAQQRGKGRVWEVQGSTGNVQSNFSQGVNGP